MSKTIQSDRPLFPLDRSDKTNKETNSDKTSKDKDADKTQIDHHALEFDPVKREGELDTTGIDTESDRTKKEQ